MAPLSHRALLSLVAIAAAATFFASIAGGANAAAAVPAAQPALSCSPKPYAYAGLIGRLPATGIEAVVTTSAVADVSSGHVAAWIGVGGPTAGPGGKAEWLQTGVNTQAGIGSQLYAEITQPGTPTRYLKLASGIAPGSAYHLAVVALAGKPDYWHVLVNGKPATAAIKLPGSSAFRPMAMGESWNGGAPHCNGFGYRFDQLQVATHGSWADLTGTSVISNLGYKVVDRTKTGFTAVSG